MVSFMTAAEIEYGMESDGWGGHRRAGMRRYLDERFSVVYPDYPDSQTVEIWASIVAGCERKGRSIAHSDAWIAATALRLSVPLVTHNARDYSAVDELLLFTQQRE